MSTIEDLETLPAAEKRKRTKKTVVQIAVLPGDRENLPSMYALRSDGRIFCRATCQRGGWTEIRKVPGT
jgi:hypothetical protein